MVLLIVPGVATVPRAIGWRTVTGPGPSGPLDEYASHSRCRARPQLPRSPFGPPRLCLPKLCGSRWSIATVPIEIAPRPYESSEPKFAKARKCRLAKDPGSDRDVDSLLDHLAGEHTWRSSATRQRELHGRRSPTTAPTPVADFATPDDLVMPDLFRAWRRVQSTRQRCSAQHRSAREMADRRTDTPPSSPVYVDQRVMM